MGDMRQGTCHMCGHNEIIQAAPIASQGLQANVLAVTHTQAWGGRQPRKPLGVMNIFVCRRCGFVQWFAFEPDKIPVGDEYATRLIRGSEPSGPYR
jgi:hypothetical protein